MFRYPFWLVVFSLCNLPVGFAGNSLGQTIQIYTHLRSFSGRPTWLLVIRNLDNNENLPYLYDFSKGDNFWIAFTFGGNYLITASTLSFSPYHYKPYNERKIYNFCNLESNGRIMRGESLYVTLKGHLTPDPNTFTCYVNHYKDANFYIVKPGMD